MTTRAYAYLRTSSATNVGADKDSDTRQRLAIQAYADSQGIEIVGEFYDKAVKGSDPVASRPGFGAMMAAIAETDVAPEWREPVGTIIVESASRLSRDQIVQEIGYQYLKGRGITIIAADYPDAFCNDTPTGDLIRTILGAVAQFEKAELVGKLKGARDRKRAATGRCEGPRQAPEECRRLAVTMRSEGLALAKIGERLAEAGYRTPAGNVYNGSSVKAMIVPGRHTSC